MFDGRVPVCRGGHHKAVDVRGGIHGLQVLLHQGVHRGRKRVRLVGRGHHAGSHARHEVFAHGRLYPGLVLEVPVEDGLGRTARGGDLFHGNTGTVGGHRVSRGGDQFDASLGTVTLPPRIPTINVL